MNVKDQLVPGSFSDADKQGIREVIRGKYRKVSDTASGKFKYPTGREGATQLGYDVSDIAVVPEQVMASFCGVDNPFSLGGIEAGEHVLDIGCGAGFDLIVAARKATEKGKAVGVDLTEEMVAKAKKAVAATGVANAEVLHISSEHLPFPDRAFDVVISNGVINLSPAKRELFGEIFRVLKPGGRLQFADMVLDGELPPEQAGSLEAWSQ